MNIQFNNNIIPIDEGINEEFLKLSLKDRTTVINIGILAFIQLKNNYIKNINQEQSNILKKEYDQMIESFKIDNQFEIKKIKNEVKYLQEMNDNKNLEINEINQKYKSEIDNNFKIYQQNIENIQNIMSQEVSMYKNQISQNIHQHQHIIQQKDQQILDQKNLFSEILQKEKQEKEKLNQQYEQSISIFQLSNNSSQKGKIGEYQIEEIINNSLTGYSIENCSKKPHQGDYHINKSKIKLMLEIKNYDSEKIRTSQLDKFYYDINYCHQNNININGAIFISMNNEIVGKKSIEFEIYNNIPIIFLSCLSNEIDRLFCSINFLEKFIQSTSNKDKQDQLYLLNFIMSKFNSLNEIIENIESEKKYIDDIQMYIKQKSDKYYKEHFKNINNLKNIFLEIENKIENTNILLDDQEETFLSIQDPNDLSKNMLKNLQQKYLMFKYQNTTLHNKSELEITRSEENKSINSENSPQTNNLSLDSITISTIDHQSSNEDIGDSVSEDKSIILYPNSITSKYPKKEVLDKWFTTFNWLNKNDHNCLFCKQCQTIFKSNYKKSIFTNHEKSIKHLSSFIQSIN